jgi:hypothetical protein
MSLARLVVTAVRIEGRSKAEVSRDYGVSPRWVYELCRRFDVEGESARKLKRHAEVVKVGPSPERTRKEAMANKDKGGAKNKKAASKTP